MDETVNNVNAKKEKFTEMENCAGQSSNEIIMTDQEKDAPCPQKYETTSLSTPEFNKEKLITSKNADGLRQRDYLGIPSDGCYENIGFRADVPSFVGTNSGTDFSNISIQGTIGIEELSEVSNGDSKVSEEFFAPNKGFVEDAINLEQIATNGSNSNSVSGNRVSSTINHDDLIINPNPAPDEVSPFPSRPQGPHSSSSPRTFLRTARAFITRRLRSSSNSSSDSRAALSRDWLFMSVITLVVSALDKLFDVLFLLTLLAEEEWMFLGVGLTFTVLSTITTSLFAAQSFWLQSSQIPTWSSTWVQQVPFKKTVFLHEKFSKPINRRILPESSRFAEPEIIYDTHDGASTSSSSGSTNIEVDENLANLQQEQVRNDGNNYSQGKFDEHDNGNKIPSRTDVRISHVRIDEEASIGLTGYGGEEREHAGASSRSRICEDSQETRRKTEDFNEATDSRGRSTLSDAVDCGAEHPSKQHFQPWVRGFVIVLFCSGLLPEAVLVIHLVLYAKAGSMRRTISKLLRETWFVQTLKLSEALLESIPQIHLKMFYYLTRYRDADLSGILDDDFEWLSSHSLGLLVNAASICIGLIAILHVHVMFKILAFIFLFINLATRVAVCASLDFVTFEGVYFIPFGVAFVVSAAAVMIITVLKCGQFRPGTRKLEKYIGIPVMRTFCKPPVDVPGVAVSAVFVAASTVCGHYINDGKLNLISVVVICGAIVGQLVPGLAWHATGISKEHQENKRRKSIEQNSWNQNLEDTAEADEADQ